MQGLAIIDIDGNNLSEIIRVIRACSLNEKSADINIYKKGLTDGLKLALEMEREQIRKVVG